MGFGWEGWGKESVDKTTTVSRPLRAASASSIVVVRAICANRVSEAGHASGSRAHQ